GDPHDRGFASGRARYGACRARPLRARPWRQQEVYKAEVEITRLSTEIVRLETRRRSATARLNALLARPIDAPLARPVKLRALPSGAALAPDALTRAGNPSLTGRDAQIAAAAAGKQLAD